MTIPILIGLMIVYAVLTRAKFDMMSDPAYRNRMARREEIRERHARNRRRRANRAKREAASTCCAEIDTAEDCCDEGTQEDVANSSCCA